MIITEKNIDKALNYFDSLNEEKFENLVDKLLDEQAYLSTFVQQNLDHFFEENEEIKDLAYNLFFTILYLFKTKFDDKYIVIDENILNTTIEKKNSEHNQEELGDFIYNQLVDSDFKKEDFLKILGILNVAILCLVSKSEIH
jgi:hypothetical protein